MIGKSSQFTAKVTMALAPMVITSQFTAQGR